MATAKISQKEYLKKYLSNDSTSNEKKKKKKKTKSGAVNAVTKANVRIIDDDYDLSQMHQISDKDLEVYAIGEDAPQIVGVVDDRPAELIAKEDYKQNEKWKVLAAVDGSLTINNFDDAGKMKSSSSHGPKEPAKRFTKYASDDDLSPVRLNERAQSVSSDNSPDRRPSSQRLKPSRFADKSPERRTRRSRSPEHRRRRTGRSSSSEGNRTRKRVSPARRKDSRSPRRNTKSDKYASRRDRSRSPYRNNRSDSDASPPRKRADSRGRSKNHRGSDASSPKRRKDSPSRDRRGSPERKPSRRRNSDDTPPRRRRDSDASPPRRRKDSDASPPRRRKDSDASPPRKRRDSDASPPRRRQKSDASPPRRRRDSDESPPRRHQIKQERSPDASPARRRKISPPRQIETDSSILNSKKLSRWSRDRSQCPPAGPSKMTKTLDGKSAGLQSAESVRQENNKFRQQEEAFFSKLSKDPSGQAEAVTRDRKTGRIRDVEAEIEAELEKVRKDQEKKAVYDRWGKGVKQIEDHRVRQQEAEHEFSKPLARYADDKDLDALLKSRDRDGDPMLEYLRSKESAKDSGKPAKPVYKGAYPENRFGIRPGYRWDGVDRSNGYEKQWFDVQNKKKASEEEEYKYMTEDM